jgi:hypothetical protein
MSEDSDFGNDIITKCIELANPRLLRRVETLGWDSEGCTRHVVYKLPTKFDKIVSFFTPSSWDWVAAVADIKIYHDTGTVKVKGSYSFILFARWFFYRKISVNACERLADPDSMLRIGKMIKELMTGRK